MSGMRWSARFAAPQLGLAGYATAGALRQAGAVAVGAGAPLVEGQPRERAADRVEHVPLQQRQLLPLQHRLLSQHRLP